VCPDLGYAWQQIVAGMQFFGAHQTLGTNPVALGFDHSLFALMKRVLAWILPAGSLNGLLRWYLPMAAISGLSLFFVRIKRIPVANQVLCLTIAAILLPPTSYDYTLLHLYAPLGVLALVALERESLGETASGVEARGMIAVFVLLALALSPQSEFIVQGVRFAAQLKALVLLALGGVGLAVPFPSSKDEAALVASSR
jgi:hypothetical protein